jgi:gamma-glutamylcyclotransferase (GGCT)/AIG2-like uncharacterized protein YtfP
MNLFFAYGSLIFNEVMIAVTGRHFESVTATLSGHARYLVADTTYPGLIESPDGEVDGALYADLDVAAYRILDRFEGEYYQRRKVRVAANLGSEFGAETYVFKPQYQHLLTQEDWDSEAFRENHLQTFLASYKGFNEIEPS